MSLERFDDIAELFDQVTDTRLHWRLRRAAVGALRPVAGRHILDLGAGPGGLALDLAGEGATVVGIDGAPEMLRRAAARVARASAGERVWLAQADAHRLPFGDDTMDAVTGLLILHLLGDPAMALRECRRVTRPGGHLALVTQSDDFDADAAENLRDPLVSLERDFLGGCYQSASSHPRRSRDQWRDLFLAAGLPAPTITLAIPQVAWLLFAENPATGESGS